MARELVSGRYNIDGDLLAGGELIAELTFNLKEWEEHGSEERIWEVTVVSGLDEATRKALPSGKELELSFRGTGSRMLVVSAKGGLEVTRGPENPNIVRAVRRAEEQAREEGGEYWQWLTHDELRHFDFPERLEGLSPPELEKRLELLRYYLANGFRNRRGNYILDDDMSHDHLREVEERRERYERWKSQQSGTD